MVEDGAEVGGCLGSWKDKELGGQVDVWETSKERKYDLGKVG